MGTNQSLDDGLTAAGIVGEIAMEGLATLCRELVAARVIDAVVVDRVRQRMLDLTQAQGVPFKHRSMLQRTIALHMPAPRSEVRPLED